MTQFSNNIGRLKARAPRAFSLLFLLLLLGNMSFAQGWERYYGLGQLYQINDIVQTADEGFLFAGNAGPAPTVVYRLNPQGDVVWFKDDFNTSIRDAGNAIIETENRNIIVAGFCNGCGTFGAEDATVYRLDAFGNQIWEETYGTGGEERFLDAIELANGDLAFVGYSENDVNNKGKEIYVVRTANDGAIIWEQSLSGQDNGMRDDEGRAILESETGQIYIAGSTVTNDDVALPYLLSLSATGDSLWSATLDGADPTIKAEIFDFVADQNGLGQTTGFTLCGSLGNSRDYYILQADLDGNLTNFNSFGDALSDQFNSIQKKEDGTYILGGFTDLTPTKGLPTICHVAANGDLIWQQTLSDPDGILLNGSINAIQITDKNQVICGGNRSLPNDVSTGSFYSTLVSVEDGTYFSNVVKGNVFLDENLDCDPDSDPGEEGIRGWKLVLRSAGDTFYGTTDPDGNYEIFCGQGTFTLNLLPPNESWSPCLSGFNLALNTDFATRILNFPVQKKNDCSYAEISLAVPYLTPCENATYDVKVENSGTKTINNSSVEFTLDEAFTFIGSSVPSANLGNNRFRFTVGELVSLSQDNFTVEVAVACDALDGEAHQITAEIFPQDLCVTVDPTWDESSLAVTAELNEIDEQINFVIENVGTGPSTDIQESVIIEDHVLFRVVPFGPLEIGDTVNIIAPADGKTYRMIVPQSANHPGDSRPTMAVEAFNPGGQTPSLGFATELPEDDYNPFKAIDHEENININNYTDQFKRGYPKGYNQDHLIDSLTDLTYQINFRNTGTEEAIRVVIRDTISTHLDPSTIQMGASSHDYTYEIYGDGILKITFEDLNLSPNGGADSDGFVKYRISQKPGNPAGTLIKSGASIYFDHSAKAITGQTCHLIQPELLERIVNIIEQPIPGLESVHVFPNPFIEFTTININGSFNIDNGIITVYDSMGKLLKNISFSGKKVVLSRTDLPTGALFFHIKSDKTLIATGQLIAQ